MEPLELASGFATIVGLIDAFNNQRTGKDELTIEEFKRYLNEKQLNTVVAMLKSNAALEESIKHFFNAGEERINEKLAVIDNALRIVSRQVDGLSSISLALGKTSISNQAIEILERIEEIAAENIYEMRDGRGIKIVLIGESRQISLDQLEERFLVDDWNTLLKHGFIIEVQSRNSGRSFVPTRSISAFLNQP